MLLRLLFLVLASLGVLAALLTVLSRNLVRAALFLVAFFFLVACQFVLLEAEFLAAIQVLVYIGAVAILLLFGIMLTRNIQGDETTRSSWPARVLCGVAAATVLAMLIVSIAREPGRGGRPAWSKAVERPPAAVDGQPPRPIGTMAQAVGIEMMTRYVLAFELAGLLLTAAVVGAIALAMHEADEPEVGRYTGREGVVGGNGPHEEGDGVPVAVGDGDGARHIPSVTDSGSSL